MKFNIKIMSIIIVVIILITYIFYYFSINNCKLLENSEGIKIGKDLTIVISEDMKVDALFIDRVANGEISYDEPFFDMIDDEHYNKLIQYMSDNNLILEPGKYIINQAWSAEKIIEALKFRER